jgi:hypothetical protein
LPVKKRLKRQDVAAARLEKLAVTPSPPAYVAAQRAHEIRGEISHIRADDDWVAGVADESCDRRPSKIVDAQDGHPAIAGLVRVPAHDRPEFRVSLSPIDAEIGSFDPSRADASGTKARHGQ